MNPNLAFYPTILRDVSNNLSIYIVYQNRLDFLSKRLEDNFIFQENEFLQNIAD